MAGNALTGAMFSVNKGNTGVGTKETTLAAIDKGVEGVESWKENIDTERLKLKTDTADKYREAEKSLNANLPSDVTVKNQALKYLSNYKDRLYNNAQLVRNGNIKPEENLIFQENGKQSFKILAQQVKSYDDELKKTIERAKGSYVLDEKTGKQVFVKPTSGAVEAAMQNIQSQISGLDAIDVDFSKSGMGQVSFYERVFDKSTSTLSVKLDKDGNKIPIKTKSKMSVLALQQGQNQRSDRLYMADEVSTLVGEKSLLGQTYAKMARLNNMSGVVTDDLRSNPQLKTMLDDAAGNLTATAQRRMSILSDNPIFNEQGQPVNTQPIPFTQYGSLTPAEKAEMQTYVYTDENGEQQTGQKRKYVQLVLKNGLIVPEEDENDRLAASRSAKSSLYAGLKRGVSGGKVDRQFDPNSASSRGARQKKTDDIGRVALANSIAVGGAGARQSIIEMMNSGVYTIANGFNEIIDMKGDKVIDGRRAMEFEVKVDDKGNTQPRYIYITNEDGSYLTQSERVEQALSLIGTNPTETEDLLNTYNKAGEKLTAVDKDALFSVSKISGSKRVKYEVTENTDLEVKNIYKAAVASVFAGVNEDVLRDGLESYISNTFKDQGIPMPSGFKVETVGNNGMKISGGGVIAQTKNESAKGTTQLMRDFILKYNNRDKESDDPKPKPKPGGDVTVKKDAFGNIIK